MATTIGYESENDCKACKKGRGIWRLLLDARAVFPRRTGAAILRRGNLQQCGPFCAQTSCQQQWTASGHARARVGNPQKGERILRLSPRQGSNSNAAHEGESRTPSTSGKGAVGGVVRFKSPLAVALWRRVRNTRWR
ncbi:hypothetical protein H4S08_000730 [Coemansia sp. RSA 1365]|nr:hypothetical protein H4S08_000730 [Coemansia sp. RSA 1365]